MSNQNDKVFFPDGFFFKESHPNSPDFVKGSVSIKVDEFKTYLSKVKGEWLNIDLKVSRDGKTYAQINTFKPDKSKSQHNPPPKEDKGAQVNFDDESESTLPF